MDQVVLIKVRYHLQVSSVILLVPQEDILEMETEGPVVLLVMVGIIPLDLVLDMVVPMVPQVVVIIMELIQIAPPLQKFEDNVDMFNILNNMSNLNKV